MFFFEIIGWEDHKLSNIENSSGKEISSVIFII